MASEHRSIVIMVGTGQQEGKPGTATAAESLHLDLQAGGRGRGRDSFHPSTREADAGEFL